MGKCTVLDQRPFAACFRIGYNIEPPRKLRLLSCLTVPDIVSGPRRGPRQPGRRVCVGGRMGAGPAGGPGV